MKRNIFKRNNRRTIALNPSRANPKRLSSVKKGRKRAEPYPQLSIGGTEKKDVFDASFGYTGFADSLSKTTTHKVQKKWIAG